METTEDPDNIFEEYKSDGENDREANDIENNETSAGVKIQPPKRIVKNPRIKFNPERLCGERGIPVLMDHFKNVKFKGYGHEKEDLDKLLSKLEHWTHRLFPSMKFEDCLHQIEKLGKKRPVQTCLRKIRLDMPILSSDFVKDDEEDDVQRNEDSEPVEVDPFDRLIGDSQVNYQPNNMAENFLDSNYMSVFSSSVQTDSISNRGQVLGSSSGSSLTEEQKERIERNRMLAAERRKARLAAMDVPSELSGEKSASQEHHIPQSFDSLFRNKENVSEDFSMDVCDVDEKEEDVPSMLNNPEAEKLGLDDLIDLVDEEEAVFDKNSVVPESFKQPSMVFDIVDQKIADRDDTLLDVREVQISCSDSEQNKYKSVLNDTESNMTTSCKTLETADCEKLELESHINLINENLESYQENSNMSCVVQDSLMDYVQNENLVLDSKEKLNIMDHKDEGYSKYSEADNTSLEIIEDTLK